MVDQITKDNMENEYNRTTIENRHGILKNYHEKDRFNSNINQDPRILEAFDTSSHSKKESYLNKQLRDNINRTMCLTPTLAQRGATGMLGL